VSARFEVDVKMVVSAMERESPRMTTLTTWELQEASDVIHVSSGVGGGPGAVGAVAEPQPVRSGAEAVRNKGSARS
jgi:hypothetical protein